MKREYIVGKRIGRLLVGEIVSAEKKGNGYYIKYSCLCDCGNIKDIPHQKLISKKRPTLSCGCLQHEKMMEANTKHGLRNHRIYNIWNKMLSRCINQNDQAYVAYGGSGIIVCDRWQESFENFLEDMGLPSKGHSLNRVGGAKVYSKETCEWADATTQCYDQKKRKDNTSGRTGVCWDDEAGKWLVTISKYGRQYKLGRFSDIEDAIKRRELAELEFYGELKQECKKI